MTITTDDIRTELDELGTHTESPATFDLNRLSYGPVGVVFAVVGKAYDLSYAMEGGIYGIYESEQDAERIAAIMTENWRLRKKELDAMPKRDFDRLSWAECREFWTKMRFYVKPLYVNAPCVDEYNSPDAQVSWSYYE